MNDSSLSRTSRYISDVFRQCTLLGEWAGGKALPLYLQANWDYQRLSLDGCACLLMWDRDGRQQQTAQKLKKMIATVAELFSGPVVYGVADTSSTNRKRLIDQGIAFVVPGKQLYLPFAALDLRENFAATRQPVKANLSVCAQQLVLLRCAGCWDDQLPAQTWAQQLGVSKMTISRAYKELDALGLAKIISQGRQVLLKFENSGKQLWENALGYLISPSRKQVLISLGDYEKQQNLFRWESGEWALTKQAMLASPERPCFAVAADEWASIKKLNSITELAWSEEDSVHVQIWRYNPAWAKHFGFDVDGIDRLSLYLSLRNIADDRIEIALEEMLDRFWNAHGEKLK